jgi:hypothetical protein
MFARFIFLPLAFLICSCGESEEDKQTRLTKKRQDYLDKKQADCLAKHNGATEFETGASLFVRNRLTIETQDSASANPSQIYWIRPLKFDLHRMGGRIELKFIESDCIFLLSCSREQAARIIELHKARPFSQYLVVFRLESVTPFHAKLAAESDGEGDNQHAYLSVESNDLSVVRYVGSLLDFCDLQAGAPGE